MNIEHSNSESQDHSPIFVLQPLTKENVHELEAIIRVVLPVQYTNKNIFTQMITNGAKLSCIVYERSNKNNQAVGCMGCRVEPILNEANNPRNNNLQICNNIGSSNTYNNICIENGRMCARIYLMTLAVLAPYRNMGIGQMMLQYLLSGVLRIEQTEPVKIKAIYLHVQEGNTGALRFYKRNGFKEKAFIKEYYKRIEPTGAHVLHMTFADCDDQ
jgi:ribosomal protein S18 acetylase RimI-like enzyme